MRVRPRGALVGVVLASLAFGASAWLGGPWLVATVREALDVGGGGEAHGGSGSGDAGTPVEIPTTLEGALRAEQTGAYVVAAAAYERLAAGPEGPRASLGAARVALETGRYEEAVTRAEAALRGDARTLREASVVAATAELAVGKEDDAERRLRAVVVADAEAFTARALLAATLRLRGARDQARDVAMDLVDAYNDERISSADAEGLAAVGVATHVLGAFQDANDAFRAAARAKPERVETQLAWAELFLEKHDAGHARECVRDALKVNASSARAHDLAARAVLAASQDFVEARAHERRALAANPRLVAAHVTTAKMALRDMQLADARRALDAALAVNPRDREALSVVAAERFLADDADGFAQAKQAVLRLSPGDAGLYAVIAEHADWEHRYEELVAMGREAISLDPDDARGYATLGINLLRQGDEPAALEALRGAWRRDRFDVRVYNVLNLYDDVIPNEYEDLRSGPLVFRFPKREREVLAPYVTPTLTAAFADMQRRYGFTPDGPVRLELYTSPSHFSVRTTGLPTAGLLGVCFGKVVTAMSPRAAPVDWGNVLWHELAHVFHLQRSRNRVPRWFTEGLAEWETTQARPQWRREDDVLLYGALHDGGFPPIARLTEAFTHARNPKAMEVAYYGAYRVIATWIAEFGFEKVASLLDGFATSSAREMNGLIARTLGRSIDELDAAFRRAELARLAKHGDDASRWLVDVPDLEAARERAAARPRDASARAAVAAAYVAAGQLEAAREEASAALRNDGHSAVAHVVSMRVHLASGSASEALAEADAVQRAGGDGYGFRLMEATAAASVTPAQRQRQLAALTRAATLDPERPEAFERLAALARDGHDAAAEERALRSLVRSNQDDRDAMKRLVALLLVRGAYEDLRALGEAMMFVDPHEASLHAALAEALAASLVGAEEAACARAELELAQATRLTTSPSPRLALVGARIARARGAAHWDRGVTETLAADPSLAEVAVRLGLR